MIRVLIIDDEPLARQLVRKYLQSESDVEIVGECGDGFEAAKSIAQFKPDVLFLDVQMPKISGFELLELLDPAPAVIFTTAFDEFALKAFEANAVDYLLKPFPAERLSKALEKFRTAHQKGTASSKAAEVKERLAEEIPQDRIVVKSGADIRILPLEEIRYLEAYDDYVKIYTRSGMFLKKQTLAHFEKKLEAASFVRIHRSYLLHLTELTRIEPAEKDQHQAILKDKTRLPLSRSGYARLKEVLGL